MFYPQKLKEIRKAKKVTQNELAGVLGKSKIIVAYWEQGRRKPGDSDIRIIAKYLNVHVCEISDLQELDSTKSNDTDFIKHKLKELDTLIEEFGELPSDVLYKIKDLKNSLINYSTLNTRLRKEIHKHDILIDNLPFIIYSKDAQLKYTFVNDAFLNTVNVELNKEAIRGTYALMHFGENEIRNILNLEKKVISTKEKIINAHVAIPGSKNQNIGLLNIIPIIENNAVKEIVCTLRDVTEKYHQEKARQELETAINNLDQLVWIAHRKINTQPNSNNLDYTFISTTEKPLWAKELQKIISEQNLNKIYPEDKKIFLSRIASKNIHQNIEYRIIVNNEVLWVREIINECDDAYFGAISNITKLKLDETINNVVYSTLDMTIEGFWIKQKKPFEKFLFLNKAIEKIWGLNLNDFYNNPALWLERIHPDDLLKESDSYYKSEYPKQRTFRIIHPAAGIRIIEDKRNCYVNSDGKEIIFGIQRDVTNE